MPLWLPHTLRAWLILGYSAVGTALLSTVVLSLLSLNELTLHSERLVREGATMSSLGGRLRDDIINLERAARQYAAVRDEQLLTLYYQRVAKVDGTLEAMAEAGLSDAFGFSLPDMRAQLADLVSAWSRSLQSGENFQAALQRIQTLSGEAERVIAAGNESIRREMQSLRAAAERSRRRILFSAAALFPGALVVLWWLLRQTSRALGSLREGIRSLGQDTQAQAIEVAGPRELQDLGGHLDWLRRRLAELESEKERFLRHVSHELKTPLASLKEAADLIGDPTIGQLNAQQSELREVLLESGHDLQEQISHLLAYAAWRREHGQLHMAWFELKPFVQELEQTFSLQLGRRRIRLRCELLAERWRGHRNRLMEALENLLSNAIKHSPDGADIEVRLVREGDYAVASVRDYGPGVPDDEKARIFEPFVRGRLATSQSLPGTGVGLSIVSECALAHGGEINVEDAHPGSRFVLRWPVDQP